LAGKVLNSEAQSFFYEGLLMEVNNEIMPSPEQMAGFFEPDDGREVHMVNLLKYKSLAVYADGRESQLTGREAYRLYTDGVQQCLAEVGGHVSFNAEVRRLTLGQVEDLWDDVAVAVYPNRSAMMTMMQLPEMAELSAHRSAGLAGQLNIETVVADALPKDNEQ